MEVGSIDNQLRTNERLEALRRLGKAVDEAGLYEQVLIPDQGPTP